MAKNISVKMIRYSEISKTFEAIKIIVTNDGIIVSHIENSEGNWIIYYANNLIAEKISIELENLKRKEKE